MLTPVDRSERLCSVRERLSGENQIPKPGAGEQSMNVLVRLPKPEAEKTRMELTARRTRMRNAMVKVRARRIVGTAKQAGKVRNHSALPNSLAELVEKSVCGGHRPET